MEAAEEEAVRERSYWRLKRHDFFPEPSFQSWGNYKQAVSQTAYRLTDRLLSRSEDSRELGEVRERSEHEMKRCLTWWDLTWIGFGSIVGAGIFVLTGQEAHDAAGPAIVLSYAASGLSAMLSVFCYTEFAVEIPSAGGSFAYLRVELGDFVAFIAAGNLLLESILGRAAVARSWTSYFAALINRRPDSLRIRTNLAAEFNLLDPIAVVVLAASAGVAMISTRKTSTINWISSAVNNAVIVFVIIAGFIHADASNMRPLLPYGARGVFQAAAIVYFAYGGFDNIATMAEETKNPARDIPVGLLGSMSVIMVIYCLMALSLTLMQRSSEMDVNAAYSAALEAVGWRWGKYVVALGALKGMTTVLLVGTLGHARYVTHIARVHMIPPLFALVHPVSGTPIYATLLVTICSAFLAFFTGLKALAHLLSVSTLFIFALLALAILVRRYYAAGVSTRSDLLKLAGFLLLIVGSSIGTSAYWGLSPRGWVGYSITLPIWALATLGLNVFLTQQRAPRTWGVPLVPWLPSASIAINLFLMGSLGSQAFLRFGICTLLMLGYYALFGVHATYDTAHHQLKMVHLDLK